MRYIQQESAPSKPKKTDKPREMPKVGKYTVENLQSRGVKSGLWEKKDG